MLYVPLVPTAGVPLNTPVAAMKFTPLGNAPLSLKVGTGKPEAVTVKEPAVPTVNVASVGLVITEAATPVPDRFTR